MIVAQTLIQSPMMTDSAKAPSQAELLAERHLQALYDFERRLAAGRLYAGTDEAGAGPLAGPVVAAAVILPEAQIRGLDDSKKLSEKKREALFEEICEKAVAFKIIEISAPEIDRMNIYQACLKGMTDAILSLDPKPLFAVSDARRLPHLGLPHEAIVKGDGRCASIAAASILAKVYRDRLMDRLEAEYPGYGFSKHKGYGTGEHLRAIDELGPTPHHRRSFTGVNGRQLSLPF
jgi:ribonuclease HII